METQGEGAGWAGAPTPSGHATPPKPPRGGQLSPLGQSVWVAKEASRYDLDLSIDG